ncbi:MAG TPA: hypothetical protein VGV08_04355 [Casimicrobiaceae bacterium]|nr:hypothetical protein [Casimicrobiaceae bacterium]
MGKLIFWLVVVVAAMFALRLVNVAKHGTDRRPSAPRDGTKPAATIRCADCGVFLPTTDSVQSARGPVCGDAQCARRRRAAAS